MQDAPRLADRVKAARAPMSQQALATKAGIAVKTLSRIESGEDTTVGTIEQIAKALGLTLVELLQFEVVNDDLIEAAS